MWFAEDTCMTGETMCIDRTHIHSALAECGSHFITCVHSVPLLSSFCSPVLLDVGVAVLLGVCVGVAVLLDVGVAVLLGVGVAVVLDAGVVGIQVLVGMLSALPA